MCVFRVEFHFRFLSSVWQINQPCCSNIPSDLGLYRLRVSSTYFPWEGREKIWEHNRLFLNCFQLLWGQKLGHLSLFPNLLLPVSYDQLESSSFSLPVSYNLLEPSDVSVALALTFADSFLLPLGVSVPRLVSSWSRVSGRPQELKIKVSKIGLLSSKCGPIMY